MNFTKHLMIDEKSMMELDIHRIRSQTEHLTAEEEKVLAEIFKNLKLKYQMESEAIDQYPRKDQTAK